MLIENEIGKKRMNPNSVIPKHPRICKFEISSDNCFTCSCVPFPSTHPLNKRN